ncbi:MAG: hypothetical protein OEY97_11190 [Nitrospirota bacterium]|nr:hypothetical protein [Nitrospirota bacterium]
MNATYTKFICVAMLTLAVLSHAWPSAAATATFSWSPVTEADVAGYLLYYGTAPGQYSSQVDVGNKTTYQVAGLASDSDVYTALRSYDFNGNLSAFSGEFRLAAPNVPALSIAGVNAPMDGVVEVRFSKPVDPATAQDPANYSISDGVRVLTATLAVDALTVRLNTSSQAGNNSYVLSVSGVASQDTTPEVLSATVSYQVNFSGGAIGVNSGNTLGMEPVGGCTASSAATGAHPGDAVMLILLLILPLLRLLRRPQGRIAHAAPRGTSHVPGITLGLILLGVATAPTALAAPVLFYSDLDSAPLGAYVTVWGKGFGTAPGTVLVGSGSTGAGDIISWSADRVEFRLPANAGNGVTLMDSSGATSNPLAFTARAQGRIFFVSAADGDNAADGLAATNQGGGHGPWANLLPMLANVAPGDVVYVRDGNYPQVDNSTWGTNLLIRDVNSGKAGLPIALVGYPGELPVVGAAGSAAPRRSIYFTGGVSDWTVAKLRLNANSTAMGFDNGGTQRQRIRVVGNTASDVPSRYGTFEFSACAECRFLGNHIYSSGQPGNKLAHLFYYGGFGAGRDVEIAWNLLHDEYGGRALQVYGHTDADRMSGLSIHDNVTFNTPYDCILVGESDAAFKGWISDAAVYNNVAYNCGNAGIRIHNPGVVARVLHNTLYNSAAGIRIQAAKQVEIHNNISASNTSHLDYTTAGSMVMSHNGYDGGGSVPGQDTHPVTGAARFVSPVNGDFSLGTLSDFLNKGVALNPPLPTVSVPLSGTPHLGALGWVGFAGVVDSTPPSAPTGLFGGWISP